MPAGKKGEEEDFGIAQMPKDTPQAKAWPVTDVLIAAIMGSSITIAFHILRLIISGIDTQRISLFSIQLSPSSLSWLFFPLICFSSLFSGLFCAFILKNLRGATPDRAHSVFAGAVSGLIGSAVGMGIVLASEILRNISSLETAVLSISANMLVGGLVSIGSSAFAAIGALAFSFIQKK